LSVRRKSLPRPVVVGDEGAYAARLGERRRLAVVSLAALGVEPVGMGRDVAEQVQGIGCFDQQDVRSVVAKDRRKRRWRYASDRRDVSRADQDVSRFAGGRE
jgi:hypothetical protein